RTGVGRAAAKTCGVKFGPKYSLAPKQIEQARQLSEEGMSVAEISVLFRVHRSTLYWALTVTA
uniref:helix-turn-helix domain-containing protein n=1 Tax=Pseudomonas viridiflava TaxID=33069 RepID=UPI0013E0C17E